MARTLVLGLLLALTAACAQGRKRSEYRPIHFGYEHDVTAEFEMAEDEPPDVIVLPFENRSGIPDAAAIVERRLLDEIRASGFTAMRLRDLPPGTPQSRSVLIMGRILDHRLRDGVHALRGAVRLQAGSFDSRWNWEARARSLAGGGVPLDALADQINIRSMLRRDVVAQRQGESL